MARRPLAIASRAAAAAFGGYATAAAATACLSVALPLSRAEAVMTATMASFAVYAGAVLWAFAAETALRAWIGIAIPGFVSLATILVLRLGGGA